MATDERRDPSITLRLGTRGSALALRQTEIVAALLRGAFSRIEARIEVIQSLGDMVRDRPLDQLDAQGIFTHQLEAALIDGRIELAIHSAKDLPSLLGAGLAIVAVPEREDARDCLVTASGITFDELPAGGRIGTGSPRRVAQLRRLRPDLQFVPIRGNVDTRRRAALTGALDGVVLAVAGLQRLGLFDAHCVPLSFEMCLPQAGQGSLAVEARIEDGATVTIAGALHSAVAGACLAAERAVLAGLAAGCQAPVAAHAEMSDDGSIQLRALVADLTGNEILVEERRGTLDDAEALGHAMAGLLRARGADRILRLAREEQR